MLAATVQLQGWRQAADPQDAFGAGSRLARRRCRRGLVVPLASEYRRCRRIRSSQVWRAGAQGASDRRRRRLAVGGRACADFRHRTGHRADACRRASFRPADADVWSSKPDGRDEWIARTPVDHRSPGARARARNPARCRRRRPGWRRFSESRQAHRRQGRWPVEELVINGAECEPFMTCDDLLDARARRRNRARDCTIFRDLLERPAEC
jgi:hypothetical protein